VVQAVVNWKNLKTGELLIENGPISGSASYSSHMDQDFKYVSILAADNLAQKIAKLMETER